MPSSSSSSSATQACGSTRYPLPCPLTPPIDGAYSSCYTTPFTLPICPTFDYQAANLTSTANLTSDHNGPTRPLLTQWTTFKMLDQKFYRSQALDVVVFAIGLAICAVTICNMLVLTPRRKRGSVIHGAVLVGLIGELMSCGCGVWLGMRGALVSSYLVLTGDWASNLFSVGWRAAMALRLLGGMVGMGSVQVAFWGVGRGLLWWLRIRFGVRAYHGVLAMLVGFGSVSFVFTVAFVLYQGWWVVLVKEGEYLPIVYGYGWYKRLNGCYRVSAGASLGLWSGCFAIAAGVVVWERRQLVFASGGLSGTGSGGSCGSTNGLMGRRRRRVRNAYEEALRLIGVVAVESFIVPIALCILSVIPRRTILTESLILPVILALLPLSSLFVTNESPIGADQETRAGGGGAAHSCGNPERMHEISLPLESLPTNPLNVFSELDITSTRPGDLERKSPQQGQTERELQEIDRM